MMPAKVWKGYLATRPIREYTKISFFSSLLGTTVSGYVLPQIPRWVWFGGFTSRRLQRHWHHDHDYIVA